MINKRAYEFKPKGKNAESITVETFSFTFQRPCGCLHIGSATWDNEADAEYVEEWTKQNTICTTHPPLVAGAGFEPATSGL